MKYRCHKYASAKNLVSTLAVEWIEIGRRFFSLYPYVVSTLAVEWIEIIAEITPLNFTHRLHPRGGVD